MIVYDSLTNNVERFVGKLELRSIKIHDGLIIREPFVLITYTTGKGQIPISTLKFLERGNFMNMKGVASSGNRNWYPLFAMAGEKISKKYNTPLIHKFENDGLKEDVNEVKRWIEKNNII